MARFISTKNRKGQIWTTDFIIGLMLFLFAVLLGVKIIFDMQPSQEHIDVYRDCLYISDNLLSAGYPTDWNDTNVILPGIAENNRVNLTKLSQFNDLEYYRTKNLLHTTSDFAFIIHNSTTVINTGQCVYGYNLTVDENCTVSFDGLEYDDLMRIDRTIIFNSTVMVMTVYAWD